MTDEQQIEFLMPYYGGDYEVWITPNGEQYIHLFKPNQDNNEWFKFDVKTRTFQSIDSDGFPEENKEKLKETLNQSLNRFFKRK